jgi:hypothetical protein
MGHQFEYLQKLEKHISHYVPKPRPKMIKNKGWHKSFFGNSWGEPTCTPKVHFFLLGAGGIRFFGVFVPNVFPSSFHWVPNNFPKFLIFSQHFPNSTLVYPISFALNFTFVIYITIPKKILQYIYFRTIKSLINYFCYGPINDAHHQKKRNSWGCHN